MKGFYLPRDTRFLATHAELVDRCQWQNCQPRWRRRLRHPVRVLLNRLRPSPTPDAQGNFIWHGGWSRPVLRQLRRLPRGFVTIYSLQAETALWLYHLVAAGSFEHIIECGCGISTAIIALAIEGTATRFSSLEHDEHWLDQTRQALKQLKVSQRVDLLHAPLEPVELDGEKYLAHSTSGLRGSGADLLLIDAPPATIGRGGVLPQLIPCLQRPALVVLDDAVRLTEEHCVQRWVSSGLATLKGYVATGQGIAVMFHQ